MVALDSSSIIAFLEGESGGDVEVVEWAFEHSQALLPPVVLCELLSDPKPSEDLRLLFKSLPLLGISSGYWERTGRLRARVLSRGRCARLADSLIAQSCIDHSVALVTRDQDFRNFAAEGRLDLFFE
ncbi:MAG: type II toxin-antitoxin system VapC family toxin [Acidobacteriota bacterium]